jgi:CubicO group peptidase (beta-lactamase class C family)
MKRQWIISVTLLLVGCNPQQLPTISENGIAEMDQFFQGAVDRHEIPGVVAIAANKDQILYHGAFGKMHVANDVEMSRDAIFDIASMTKPITSVAVMMLYEEGRLDLDDPISKYISSLKDREVINQFNESDTTYRTRPA